MKTIRSVLIALMLVRGLGLAHAAADPGSFSTDLSDTGPPRSGNSENFDPEIPHPDGAVASPLPQQAGSNPSLIHGRRESPGPSSRRTAMVLCEVHHQPPPDGAGQDLRFIELYNSNPFPEDLSGWYFTGDVDYRIPEGTIVPGLGYLVVAPRPNDLARAYGIELPLGGFSTRLGPGRGHVRLHKRSGGIVLQVEFTADAAWETGSQGGGATRVLSRPSLGEANPLAWSPSVFLGGSPGRPEPEPPTDLTGIALNELLTPSAGATNGFVEIHNRGPLPADLSHAVLTTSPSFETYPFPSGSLLGVGDFLVIDGPAIAALLAPSGNSLHLLSPDRQRVLDSIRYPGQKPGFSYGRVHDFASRWDVTEVPTPGFQNAPARRPDIVFSEIHFDPLSDDENEEFVEIHNRSSNIVSLDGWRLDGGVTFPFSPGTFLEPGSFLAIARNPDRCRELHPEVPPGRIVGGFDGSLRNRGERLTLLRPVPRTNDSAAPGSPKPVGHLAVEDTIHYRPTGRGRAWAAGGGSSLERTDFDTPTGDLQPWRASDETSKTSWTTVQSTGALTLTHPGVPSADQLQILLLGPGEALVDDVEVIVNGNNQLANGRFESGTNTWVFQGTHRTSRVDPGTGPDGSRALHVIASDRGDHVANRIRTPLTRPIPANGIATIRAKLRWLAGHPEILFRLRNGGLEAVGRLAPSTATGSPGASNSPAIAPSAPSISDLHHQPVLPAANQTVRVNARVSDPQGISQVHLVYRRDPSTNLTSVSMSDDGFEPDEFARDGIFTGAIAGQPTGSMIAFRVIAEDGLGHRSVHPRTDNEIPREALVRFGESPSTGTFGSYRIWMTAAARDAWTRREKMSNEDIAVTFVSGTDRSIHNAGAHYSGSSYTSPIYDSPTGALCGYDLTFPEDDRFLGADRATLDWPIRDDTDQRETLMFWFLEQYGLPNLHRRHVRLTVNGVRRGSIYDDVQQPDGDTAEQWYPDDAEGSLWKTDCWNEFDNVGNRIDPCILNSLERFPSTGAKKTARYRWNWRPRALQSSANDFTDLFALIDAANASTDYVPAVEALVDVDHWMRTFAMNDLASYWDAFGNPNSKNSFLYKPRHNRWQIFCWDFDVGLGVFNDPPTAALFDVSDPTIARMYRTPAFVRRYWAALLEATDTWFRIGGDSPIDRLLDSKYAAFQAQGIGLAHPGSIKTWIRGRRTYLLQQLAGVRSDFAISSNNGRDFTSTQESISLSGRAPVSVATLRIQGRERTVSWTTVSNWNVQVSLQPGINTLPVEGFDRRGMPVPGASDSIQITYSGAPAALPQIRINEWLAQNSHTLTNPVTGETDDWFELHNAGTTPVDLSGYTLTDRLSSPDRSIIPAGIQLASGGFLLVWADDRPEASRSGSDLHVGFQLAQDGELIALYDTLGRLVDSVSFPPQHPDQSEGRWPDGELPPFLQFPSPSPGRPNTTPPYPPDDFLVTAGWNPEDSRIRITWRSVAGRRYQPEFTEDLQNPRWEALGTPILANTDVSSATDPGPFRAQRYYRVVLLR